MTSPRLSLSLCVCCVLCVCVCVSHLHYGCWNQKIFSIGRQCASAVTDSLSLSRPPREEGEKRKEPPLPRSLFSLYREREKTEIERKGDPKRSSPLDRERERNSLSLSPSPSLSLSLLSPSPLSLSLLSSLSPLSPSLSLSLSLSLPPPPLCAVGSSSRVRR